MGLLVVALVAGGAWLLLNRGRVEVGVVGEDVALSQVGRSTPSEEPIEMLLPGATLQVNVVVGGVGERDGNEIRPPLGGSLVRLQWWVRPTGSVRPGEDPIGDLAEGGPLVLTATAGGRSVQVPDDAGIRLHPRSRGGSTVIALPGTGGDLRLVARFAELPQWVEPFTGRRNEASFASLYLDSQGERRSGPRPMIASGISWSARSYIEWSRTPWHPEHGWARPGREWLVLRSVDVQLTRFVKGKEPFARVANQPGSVTFSGPDAWVVGEMPQLSGRTDIAAGPARAVLSVPRNEPVQLALESSFVVGPYGRPEGAVRLQHVERFEIFAPGTPTSGSASQRS